VRKLLVNLWHGWKEIAGYIGDFQARALLTIFYFTVLAPFAMLSRLLGDPLHIRRWPGESGWAPRKASEADLRGARRQF
jgi:hypothetical protein